MSTAPRSNGDYISVPNPVTTPPNDSSDITPPDISNSNSSNSSSAATATADPDYIAPIPALTTDSDTVAIDVQLLSLRELHDALVSVVTNPLLEQIPLKPPFSDLPREDAGLLTEERVEELRTSDRDNAAMLRKSIVRLIIDAATTGVSGDWECDDNEMSERVFYYRTDSLSRKLANDEDLTDEDRTVVGRLGSIIWSLSAHLVTLIDIKVEIYGYMVRVFDFVVYDAFFTVYLAASCFNIRYPPVLLARLRLSHGDFKRLLPVIEAETYRRVVPRCATHCSAYAVGSESMTLARSRGICTYEVYDDKDPIGHGYWIEAEGKRGSKLVFRNLECPGGDECPISCDRVQLALRYKANKGSATKSKKKNKSKKSKAMKHKPFKPQAGEPSHNRTFNIVNTTSSHNIEQEEDDSDDDADDADDGDIIDRLGDSSESDDHDFQKFGLMLPKDFIQSSVSRGVFGFKRQPLMFLWHFSVIGMTVVMFLLAFGVINTNSSHESAAANSADSNGNGNNRTTTENIVSSGNVTNFIMRGATYLASNASSFIAVISATGIPGAFVVLTRIREFKYPATTYFELLATKAAVTSFKKACKLKGVCPGCLMAAVLRNRAALMLLAFGQFAGLVGANSLEPKAAKMCFDCRGSTTCLFRAGMHFIQAFAVYDQDTDEMVEGMSGRYRQKLPSDCSAWTKYSCEQSWRGDYYLAQPNKAFLVREIPDWSGVAMVGYVTVLNNKVGRLTYFKDPIIVGPLSTPMIDFQYIM
ncbi:hypothetical protein GQ42DRAFT_179811 [Ramicandelaber brevisporus]|nr:hypothetical protein GQ42DRAFT_179811 [Ramicandelaber brevisporus]